MLTPTYPIRTARLVLRPFTQTDLDELHAFQSLPEVARYLYWEARSRQETADALEKRIAGARITTEGQTLALAVERTDTGALIGDLTLCWLSAEHRRGEIGFVFHPDHHGHGYAQEAAEALLLLAFRDLGLRRAVGHCDARNTASAALMRRLGMTLDARLRENQFFKGDWTDELVYAILEREWAAGRGTPA
ncbi:GNAT family N-acetyltransferase [Amycolatopsis antarctica]|uniref:GNAT family N-acetyltransferase n=1 Tax=Amycolatopsis antarctica TaxID=1854586 RepID=A0A263D840_9PSEU|nr:GNAT family protein [Amycolatopsis antarctica]OZM74650.1 GNAT family N-acetyltransferase [Amycolatopsis antarctica]